MSYIKKEYQCILNYLDNSLNSTIPNDFNNYIKKAISNYHNLIIQKGKNNCICTNCNHQFISNTKINEFQKCSNCKNTFLTKSIKLKNYSFRDTVILMNNIDGILVARLFDIKSSYNNSKDLNFNFSVSEFSRVFIEDNKNTTFLNDRVSKNSGNLYVYHNMKIEKWRSQGYRNYGAYPTGFIYYKNLQKVLSSTKYKYSQIWNLIKYNNEYFSIDTLLRKSYDFPEFELLIKSKMYNLSLEVNNLTFASKKEIFYTIKRYSKFIKKYNLNYKQFRLLYILQEDNINKIRYLESLIHHKSYHFNTLIDISMCINLNNLIKYSKIHRKKIDLDLYKDYLEFAKILGLDLKNKRYIYPSNLQQEHDELEKYVKIHNRKLINQSISKRINALNENIFKDKKYIIYPAKSLEDLEYESTYQKNCVRTYSENYADGKCDIYFMRPVNNIDKSLVTIEVKDNCVVQRKSKNNTTPLDKYLTFIDKWEQDILKKKVA